MFFPELLDIPLSVAVHPLPNFHASTPTLRRQPSAKDRLVQKQGRLEFPRMATSVFYMFFQNTVAAPPRAGEIEWAFVTTSAQNVVKVILYDS